MPRSIQRYTLPVFLPLTPFEVVTKFIVSRIWQSGAKYLISIPPPPPPPSSYPFHLLISRASLREGPVLKLGLLCTPECAAITTRWPCFSHMQVMLRFSVWEGRRMLETRWRTCSWHFLVALPYHMLQDIIPSPPPPPPTPWRLLETLNGWLLVIRPNGKWPFSHQVQSSAPPPPLKNAEISAANGCTYHLNKITWYGVACVFKLSYVAKMSSFFPPRATLEKNKWTQW